MADVSQLEVKLPELTPEEQARLNDWAAVIAHTFTLQVNHYAFHMSQKFQQYSDMQFELVKERLKAEAEKVAPA